MNNLRSAAPLVTALVAALAGSPASAQSQANETPAVGRPLTFGTLQVYPSISMRDIGVDTNIYNESVVVRQDFTYTVAPRVLAELPLEIHTSSARWIGLRVSGSTRSANAQQHGQCLFEVRSGRVRPSILAGFSRARQRQATWTFGPQRIDQRPRRYGCGRRGITSFTAGRARQDGVRIRRNVQRRRAQRRTGPQHDDVSAGVRLDLTPLTSVVTAAEFEQARFTVARERDANSLKVSPAVDSPKARSSPASVAGVAGLPAADRAHAAVSRPHRERRRCYTLMNVTRFEVHATRDITYSYDKLFPYYLESGGQLTVSQRIVARWMR